MMLDYVRQDTRYKHNMTYATPFGGDKKKAKSNGAESKDEKKDALAKDATQWVVVGIGNLKVNVPKPDVTGPSPPPLPQ